MAYPLAIPLSPAPQSVTIKPLTVVGISRSPLTLAQQVQRGWGQAWSAEVTLPPMRRQAAERWIAWALQLNGPEGVFGMGDPDATVMLGSGAGAPVVDGKAALRSHAIPTRGWLPYHTEVLRAGDYIQLGTGLDSRLHKVLTDVSSDDRGRATLDVWPFLRRDYRDGEPLVTEYPVGVWRLQELPAWTADAASVYGMSLSCYEAL